MLQYVATVSTVFTVMTVLTVLTVLIEFIGNLKKVSITYSLTHLLTDNLKSRDASASKNLELKNTKL